MAETAPGEVLVDTYVFVIQGESCLIGALCLLEVFLFLIEKSNFDECVDLFLDREGASEDGILEELACLVDLVCLCEDSA